MNENLPRGRGQLLGVFLIALGALFLAGQVFDFDPGSLFDFEWADVSWPLYIIIPGLVLIFLGMAAGRASSALTILGSLLALTGILLAYMEESGTYSAWAYAWALIFPTSIGLGQVIHGYFHHQPDMVNNGARLALAGLVLFVIGLSFFEGTIGLNSVENRTLSRIAGPALLIGVGVYLLWRRESSPEKSKR